MVRLAMPFDPLESASIIDRRRLAIEYLGQAIFTDRQLGAQLARQVLASMPIPDHAFQEKKTA